MNTNPWLFLLMLPAAALLMLHVAVGPFGHPSLLHWHKKWRATRPLLQQSAVLLAALTLILGTGHLLGFWSL